MATPIDPLSDLQALGQSPQLTGALLKNKTALLQYNIQRGQYYMYQIQNSLKRQGATSVTYGATFSITDMYKSAVQQAMEQMATIVSLYADALRVSIAGARSKFYSAFTAIGEEANIATVAAYERVHAARNSPASYRQGNGRYSGGLLARALASPEMYLAGTNGVSWPNFSFMDQVARQWARLNFGAGPRAQAGLNASGIEEGGIATSASSVKVFGDELNTLSSGMRLSLASFRPGSAFFIPAGFWTAGGQQVGPDTGRTGSDAFYPGGSAFANNQSLKAAKGQASNNFQRRKLTQGVAAWGFLNAGISSIAQNGPVVISSLVLDAVNATKINPNTGPLRTLNFDAGILDRFAVGTETLMSQQTVTARATYEKIISGL